MKCLLLILALSACAASNPFAPKPAFAANTVVGGIVFQIDANSCKYSGPRSTTFMIGNADVGTESLAPGQSSVVYQAVGPVTVQARIAGFTSAYFTTPITLWSQRYTVIAPASGNPVTQVITC